VRGIKREGSAAAHFRQPDSPGARRRGKCHTCRACACKCGTCKLGAHPGECPQGRRSSISMGRGRAPPAQCVCVCVCARVGACVCVRM